MIGTFKDAATAKKTKALVDRISKQLQKDLDNKLTEFGDHVSSFTDGMLKLLGDINFGMIGAIELQQFAYDVRVSLKGRRLILTTDESDVSGIFKLFLQQGAKIEMFSAHEHVFDPDEYK